MTKADAFHRPIGTIWVFAFYLLLMGFIAFGMRDAPSEPNVRAMTIDKIIHEGLYRLNDPSSFASAAVDIYETGWIREENNWIFNLWPPGLPLLQAVVLTVFGRDIPILAVLQGLAVLLHASVALALFWTLHRYVNWTFAVIGGIVPFAFPLTRVYLLQPTAVALGETFAVGFFALGVLASLSAVREPRYVLGVAAGLAFGLAAYFRSQFEFILSIQTLVVLFLLFLTFLGLPRKLLGLQISRGSMTCLVVIVLSTQISMLPWRVYHMIHEGTSKWVFTSDLIIGNAVKSDAELNAVGGNFVVRGGGNVVCHINPETCNNAELARSNFFQTFFNHPIKWLEYKMGFLPEYWFAPVGNWTDVIAKPTRLDLLYNILFGIFIATAVVLSLFARTIREDTAWIALLVFNVSLVAAYGAILMFAHLEVRYLYFPKFIGTVLFLVQFSMLWGHRSARKS